MVVYVLLVDDGDEWNCWGVYSSYKLAQYEGKRLISLSLQDTDFHFSFRVQTSIVDAN